MTKHSSDNINSPAVNDAGECDVVGMAELPDTQHLVASLQDAAGDNETESDNDGRSDYNYSPKDDNEEPDDTQLTTLGW